MKRLSARWIASLVATGIGLYLCWLMLRPFVDVVIWAGVLAVIAYPVHARLRARGRGPAVSAAATTLLVVMTVVVPLTLVAVALVREAAHAVESLRANKARIKAAFDPNNRVFRWVDQYVNVDPLLDAQKVSETISNFSGQIAARMLGFVGGTLGAVVQVFFVLFTLYYLLKDSDSIVPAITHALPLEEQQSARIFTRTKDVISASINGVLVISAIQGVLGAIGFGVCRLPSPLLWGVIMFFCSMIPMAGAFIVWVPAAIYLAATGQWWKAAFLTVWGAVVIGMVDNLLRPRLVGGKTRLHELLVFFSVLGGLQVFGVLGLVVGPVVLAITLALVDVFRQANPETALTEIGDRPAPAVVETPPPAPADTPAPPPGLLLVGPEPTVPRREKRKNKRRK